MLILQTTTDSLEIITSATCDVDYVTSYMDCTQASPPLMSQPERTAGNITTATTTTNVIAAPGGTLRRNVKYINIRNAHASTSVDITVQLDVSGTNYELIKTTLLAGETLEYKDNLGWFKVQTATTAYRTSGAATTAQIASHSADTYYLGFPTNGRLQAGSFFRWAFRVVKTAGTATPIYTVRFGTAGTVSDTARATMTGVAQTAVADNGYVIVEAGFRAVGASAVIACHQTLTHNLAVTGLANINAPTTQATSSTFDSTVAGSIIGLSVNPGTSGAWVVELCTLDAVNLIS